MLFDKRIKNPKRDIISFLNLYNAADAYKESLNGKRGFFANMLQEIAYLLDCHFKKLARIDLDADSEDYTVKFIKELDKAKRRFISEKIGKKLTEKGYSSKKVGPFTFYIKTREEYTAALRQTLEFAENMAEASVRNRNENTELMQFFSMTILYLSDLLEKVEAEDKKDNENNA